MEITHNKQAAQHSALVEVECHANVKGRIIPLAQNDALSDPSFTIKDSFSIRKANHAPLV
jgi:hypothetical protein